MGVIMIDMEKEKSVLTEAEIAGIFLANIEKGVSGQYRAIEQKVLANYKKGLREKVQEQLDLIIEEGGGKGNLNPYREGQITVFEWLLKELGEK
jgi:hypothetical protein